MSVGPLVRRSGEMVVVSLPAPEEKNDRNLLIFLQNRAKGVVYESSIIFENRFKDIREKHSQRESSGLTGLICGPIFIKSVCMTASVACSWAGAVMWGAGAAGVAVYTTTSVPSDWAGAVMRKPLANAEKGNAGQTDSHDGRNDGRTDD